MLSFILDNSYLKGDLTMIQMDNVTIRVPSEMKRYLQNTNEKTEMCRNALMLYTYILNGSISYGRAAEILGVDKWKLIEFYDEIGLPYLSQDISEINDEVSYFEKLKDEKK